MAKLPTNLNSHHEDTLFAPMLGDDALAQDPMQQREPEITIGSEFRIEPADMPYFEKVFAMHAQAQNFQAQASQYETEAARLRGEATALLGAHNSYVAHLFEKYNLTPGQDQIDQSGHIVRKGLP